MPASRSSSRVALMVLAAVSCLSLQLVSSAEPMPDATPKSERAFLVDVPMLETTWQRRSPRQGDGFGSSNSMKNGRRRTIKTQRFSRKEHSWRCLDGSKSLAIPEMARQHPEWMAGLGHHDDWRKRLSRFSKAGPDEVVKAWPWVTIWYEEAFQCSLPASRTALGGASRPCGSVFERYSGGAVFVRLRQ